MSAPVAERSERSALAGELPIDAGAAVFSNVGAFPLPARSADATFVLALAPGGYTVRLTAADARAGDGLIEVYELP